MWYVWSDSFWTTLGHLHRWLGPLRELLDTVQADWVPLSEAVELCIPVFKFLQSECSVFAPGDTRKVTALLQKRRDELLTPVALAANILDYRFRGQKLDQAERAQALRRFPALAEASDIMFPGMHHAVFAGAGEWHAVDLVRPPRTMPCLFFFLF